MKKFVNQLLVYLLPIFFYGVLVLVINLKDPFKVFGTYKMYYETSIVDLNRENVCLQLFKNNSKKIKYNSFIFGSSRSLAFKIPNWQKHIDSAAVGFHFDATGEGIYGVFNKLSYLKTHTIAVKNALLIIDYSLLTTTNNRSGHLSIAPHELSGESPFSYYKEYVWATSNFNFIKEYFQYKVLGKYNNNNNYIFPNLKNTIKSNNETGDIYFESEKKIALNKQKYYKRMIDKGVFYNRKIVVNKEMPMTDKELYFLKAIKTILTEKKTNYKIVISPLYDQKALSNKRKKVLFAIFGKQNVFDFSGKNKFTNSIYNYYESSHYRPNVANEIMDVVYKNIVK
jgi:hypothetical protein